MPPVDKSCRTVEHYTPPWLTEVVARYARAIGYDGIELDPATEADNWTKAGAIFTEADDGLERDWNVRKVGREAGRFGTFAFVNPPYGRALRSWVEKACEQARDNSIVALLPGQRFEQRYWQERLMRPSTSLVVPITGRVDFYGRVCRKCSLLESHAFHKEGDGGRVVCAFDWSGERAEGMGNPYGSFLYLLGCHQVEVAAGVFQEVGAPFEIGRAWPFKPLVGSPRFRKGLARGGRGGGYGRA